MTSLSMLGLTLGLAASSTTIPTWLLALKAGLLGKSLLLSAGTAGAGVRHNIGPYQQLIVRCTKTL